GGFLRLMGYDMGAQVRDEMFVRAAGDSQFLSAAEEFARRAQALEKLGCSWSSDGDLLNAATARLRLLRQLHRYGLRAEFCFTAAQWSNQLDLPIQLLPALIEECVNDGIITAHVYDGERFKSIHEWSDLGAFFNNTTDYGFIRISITAAGLEHAETLHSAGALRVTAAVRHRFDTGTPEEQPRQFEPLLAT